MSKYYGFPVYQDGDITIGHQRMADVMDEIVPLYAKHFVETEEKYLDTEYEPNYEQYLAAEERGNFVLFTVRKGSTLVGYMQYHIYNWAHSRRLRHAKEDALYVAEEHRGGGLSKKVLDYTEDFLQKLGCAYVGMTSKAPVGSTDIGPYLETRGYRPVAVYYVKELEK